MNKRSDLHDNVSASFQEADVPREDGGQRDSGVQVAARNVGCDVNCSHRN